MDTEALLHSFEPEAGDCVFIRAGTLHAIGAGLVIAEIQQASDTTFRIFDWNRVDKNGEPRELHIDESLMATDFALGPVDPLQPAESEFPNADILVSNNKFVMKKWCLSEPQAFADDRMHIFAVTAGSICVSDDPSGEDLHAGNTILVPAACRKVIVHPNEQTEMLDIVLPD